MKTLTTILAATFIAGGATIAMAQGGAAGGAGGDTNPDRMGKGADQNPSSPGAHPAAGSTDAKSAGQARTGTSGGMVTAPVSGTTKSNNSSTPSQAPTGTSK